MWFEPTHLAAEKRVEQYTGIRESLALHFQGRNNADEGAAALTKIEI